MSIHRLMPDILADTMITSARARKPFSMVRMGDGEFAVMKYPKYCERNICIDHISRWFDVSNITEKQVLFISKAIWESCITADLLGIPSGREQGYLKWARLEWFMEYFKLMKATHFHFYLIMQMHLEGVFHKMLADFDEAFCITCRNVEEGMKRSFGLKKVTTLGISSELFRMHRADKGISKFNEENALDNSHHFDVRFQQIYDWLQANDCRGRIFFVGAGGLGKIYCMWIKQHGGMAYDIGALFDGWAGLRTRPYLNDVQRFRL